jgi:hypothetical protein
MKYATSGALIGLLMLAACGNAQFEKGFNEAFEKSARESCMSSAAKSGAPADQIAPYCTCFVDQLKGLSAQEKMKLDPNSPKVAQAVEACRPK